MNLKEKAEQYLASVSVGYDRRYVERDPGFRDRLMAYAEAPSLDTYPAFDNNLSKDEMVDHLVNIHGLKSVGRRGLAISTYAGTKATKDEMISWHAHVHEMQEDPDAEFGYAGWTRDSEGNQVLQVTLGGYPVPSIKHSHLAGVVPDDLQAKAEALKANKGLTGDKPITAAEAKVLTDLVNNDFGTLKQQMKAFAADAAAAKKNEVNAEWDEKERSIPDYADQATTLVRAQRDEFEALKRKHREAEQALRDRQTDAYKKIANKAEAEGITLSEESEDAYDEEGNYVGKKVAFKATVQGRTDALKEVERETQDMLNRALMDLEEQRLTALRRILVSRVNPEAAKVLDNIPSAKDLMVEAQQKKTAREIEASNATS